MQAAALAMPTRRDYSLIGRDSQLAVESGLAAAEWYHTDIPRKQMKELMKRSDGPAIRDTAIWLGSMLIFAGLGVYFWGTWLCVPFFLAYGVLYGSASDSRWHECGHGTAFKTRWMNDVVYQIACFMIMRNPVTWRWSHTRHHTDTVIVGRDPEIAVMRPPDLSACRIEFLRYFGCLARHGRHHPQRLGNCQRRGKDLHSGAGTAKGDPHRPHLARDLCRHDRGLSLYLGSILPLVLIGLPRLYGAWHHVLTGLLQHGGLADNVTDHRLNSRTVLMNPVSRFIYWNMNYHVEHHMFPMVPYHALPQLHAMIKHDLPAANPSILHGYREMVPAFLRQLRNEDYFLKRELPPTAKPYREEFHGESVAAAAE